METGANELWNVLQQGNRNFAFILSVLEGTMMKMCFVGGAHGSPSGKPRTPSCQLRTL